MIRRIALAVIALVGALVLYLVVWPVPIEPVAWEPPPYHGYTGVHAANDKLARLHHIDLKGEIGPEHVALGKDGRLYTTVASGRILRMNADGSGLEVFAEPGGRILGFDFDAAGNLVGADAMRGLISIAPDRKVTVLVDQLGGKPILYADAVVVARNGKMYFSDASTRFSPKDWGGTFEASVHDILEQASTGRILEYDPATKATRVVAHGFAFANGVALSQDEQWLFVAETGKYRIWKVAVAASNLAVQPGHAQASVLLDALPGFPDNLMRGQDGRIWAGFAKPRNPAIEDLARKPFLRKVTLRLPRAMWPIPKVYGHVFAFTEDGKVVADLQDPAGAYPETTAVTETADRLYIQSLHAHTLGWLPRPR